MLSYEVKMEETRGQFCDVIITQDVLTEDEAGRLMTNLDNKLTVSAFLLTTYFDVITMPA